MHAKEQLKPGAGETARTPADVNDGAHLQNETEHNSAVENSGADAIRAARYWRMDVSLGVLAVIALIGALYLGRDFIVPLLIGILASYTLTPLVDWLKRCYVPRPLGAVLVLLVLIGGLTWVAFSLSDDAAAMIEKLPEVTRKMQQNLEGTRIGSAALRNTPYAAKQPEENPAVAGAKSGAAVATPAAGDPSAWLRDYALSQSSSLITIVVQAIIVLILTYFLLASGAHFRRKLVDFVGPSLARQADAVRILDEITVQIQLYLLTIFVSNILIGIGIWLAFWAFGMEQAALWGAITGVLSFIPYLGPASAALASGVAAFLQFGSLLSALAVTGVSLLVTGAVGFIFMPWLQSRFAHVNAAVLFIALLFFGWLWGAFGLLLGAPLIAIVKVICDRIEPLKSVGALLGR